LKVAAAREEDLKEVTEREEKREREYDLMDFDKVK